MSNLPKTISEVKNSLIIANENTNTTSVIQDMILKKDNPSLLSIAVNGLQKALNNKLTISCPQIENSPIDLTEEEITELCNT